MAEQSRHVKTEIRSRLLESRAALDERERRILDRRICEHLIRFLNGHDSLDLAAYAPFRGEPDLMPALAEMHRAGRRIHLPVLRDRELEFRRWLPDAPMRENRYGIPEPVSGRACPPDRLALVFAPLVGFAPSGARLGMGAGYYDRTFAFCREPHRDHRPLLVGTAYGLQEVDDLPVQDWDVLLDAVITEEGVREFDPNKKIENRKS